jgi:hypothetical protein
VIPEAMRRPNQDVLAGLMFLLFGAMALILGRNLQVGTSSQMGAGYFPLVLGVLLLIVGLAITVVGLWRGGAAFLLFAVAIEWAGLLLTAPVCTMLAAMGTVRFRTVQHTTLAIAVSLVAVAIFIWALKIPIPLLPAIS